MNETKNDDHIAMENADQSQQDFVIKDNNISHLPPDSFVREECSEQVPDDENCDKASIADTGGSHMDIDSHNDDSDVEDPELEEIKNVTLASGDNKELPLRKDNLIGDDVCNNVTSTRLRSRRYRPNYAEMVWKDSSASEDSESDSEKLSTKSTSTYNLTADDEFKANEVLMEAEIPRSSDKINSKVSINESNSSKKIRKVKGKVKEIKNSDDEYLPSENEDVSASNDDEEEEEEDSTSSNEDEVNVTKKLLKNAVVLQKMKKSWKKINLEDHKDKYCIENLESFEQQHRKKDNTSVKAFSCLVCKQFKCAEKIVLSDHIEEHINKVLECKKCDFIASHKHELQQHIQEFGHFKANFVCDLCGMAFNSIEKRKSHLANIHDIPVFKCMLCTEMFSCKLLRKTHMRSFHSDVCQFCKNCSNCLPSWSPKMFQKHLKRCGSIAQCETCGIKVRAKALTAHVRRVHTNLRRFQCKLCPYSAKDRGHLKRHLLAHNNEHPYQCEICPFSCVQTIQLSSHMRTHTGEKPFKCTQCKYAAAWNVQLKDHMKVHELNTAVMCKQCDVLLKNNTALKLHVKKNHS